jgi:hypothetical protein
LLPSLLLARVAHRCTERSTQIRPRTPSLSNDDAADAARLVPR